MVCIVLNCCVRLLPRVIHDVVGLVIVIWGVFVVKVKASEFRKKGGRFIVGVNKYFFR